MRAGFYGYNFFTNNKKNIKYVPARTNAVPLLAQLVDIVNNPAAAAAAAVAAPVTVLNVSATPSAV